MQKPAPAYIVGFFSAHALGAFAVHLAGKENELKLFLLKILGYFYHSEAITNALVTKLGVSGFFGTYWLILLFGALSFALGYVAYAISYLFSHHVVHPIPPTYKAEDMSLNIGAGQTHGVKIVFSTPEISKTKRTEARKSIMFDWPVRRVYFALRGQNIGKDHVTDPIDRLKLSAVGIYKAHLDVPAAVTGHHGGESLYNHTMLVVANIRKYSNDRLADLVALFHDIGKLETYKKGPNGKWSRKFYDHNSLTFTIVRHLPDFALLPEVDQLTLRDVLTYAHKPRLPIHLENNDRVLSLIKALKKADSVATHKETSSNNPETEGSSEITPIVLLEAISKLNINGYLGPTNQGGWHYRGGEYLLINTMNLFNELKKMLSPESAAALQLDIHIMNKPDHPGLSAVFDAMKQGGLYLERIRDVESDTGLYDVKIGKIKYQKVMVFEKKDIASFVDPETFNAWGDYPHGWANTVPATFD